MTRLVAFVFLTCALVAAVVIHRHTHMETCGLGVDKPACAGRDGWQDPIAVAITATGFVVAGVLLYGERRNEE